MIYDYIINEKSICFMNSIIIYINFHCLIAEFNQFNQDLLMQIKLNEIDYQIDEFDFLELLEQENQKFIKHEKNKNDHDDYKFNNDDNVNIITNLNINMN